MSNRKKTQENERKVLEKKRLLIQMKREVESIEKQIKYLNVVNFKTSMIKNLKISARAAQLVAPYILTAGICVGGCKLLGAGFPFYRDDINKYSNIMTELDNDGKIRTEQQYDKFDHDSNTLLYYGKWEKNEDGVYSRKVEKYSFDNFTIDDVIDLFNKEDMNLKELFGKPKSSIIETNNSLEEDEINAKPYLQATIYDEDKNDYITIKESVVDNFCMSIVCIFITVCAEAILLGFRTDILKFDFRQCIEKIQEKNEKVDIESLTKKLEIKRDNYNRLIRK